MVDIGGKAISILAGNLNSGHSYLITAVQIIIFGPIVWRKMIRGAEAEVMRSVTDFPKYES